MGGANDIAIRTRKQKPVKAQAEEPVELERPQAPPPPPPVLQALHRVHRALGHPTSRELRRMLVLSGASQQALDAVAHVKCDARGGTRGAKLQAAVAPEVRASRFGERVGCNLVTIPIVVIGKTLKFVDGATRFQVAVRVATKHLAAVPDAFVQGSAAWAGFPENCVLDQGGESFRELADESEASAVKVN